MTLPQVPTPVGVPGVTRVYSKSGFRPDGSFGGIEVFLDARPPIPATSTDPSRLKALEKAVKTAKPMNKG